MESKVSVIILAAGNGSRMNRDINKLFLSIGDKPLLAHTIEKFENSNLTGEIIVVLQKKDIETFKKLILEPYNFKDIKIVEGGEDRQDSAYNGIKALDEDTDLVLIHDGARPFVSNAIIQDCIEKTKLNGAAVSSIPAVDTIKFSKNNRDIDYSPPREYLFEAQTPQGFSFPLILGAYKLLEVDYFPVTDDASVLEHLGFKPSLSKGDKTNIKVTTPDDLILAEALNKIINFWGNNGI